MFSINIIDQSRIEVAMWGSGKKLSFTVDLANKKINGADPDSWLSGVDHINRAALTAAMLVTTNNQFSESVLPFRKELRRLLLHQVFQAQPASQVRMRTEEDGKMTIAVEDYALVCWPGKSRELLISGSRAVKQTEATQYWALLFYAAAKSKQ